MTRRVISSALIAVAVAFAVAGCSSEKKRQVVTGTVSRGGQPLPNCFIRFHGTDGNLTSTPVGQDGTFTMTDVFPGEYKVTFQLEVEKGGYSKQPQKPKPPGPTIPAKYLDPKTTDLVYTITPETASITVDMK